MSYAPLTAGELALELKVFGFLTLALLSKLPDSRFEKHDGSVYFYRHPDDRDECSYDRKKSAK